METQKKLVAPWEIALGIGFIGLVFALAVYGQGWWIDNKVAACVAKDGHPVVAGVAVFATVRCE